MTRPAFSVVIVNYFSGLLTKACIQSIRRSAPKGPYEIFVVDNASTDDSREILTTDIEDIRTHFSPANVGFAKAVNLALRETSGEFVLLLNPDIIVLEGAVEKLLTFMQDHPHVGIAAGQLLNPNGTIQESALQFYTPATILYRRTLLGKLPWAQRHLRRVFMHDADLSREQPVDWVLGACMCVRRKAIEDVGPMDERFFLYFEDMDWCRRFWEKGWEVWYVPSARFAHYHKRESAQEQGLLALFHPVARTHIASGMKYFLKYRGVDAVPSRRRHP
jgi:N-acetylglucosaminyl-diphospho-decaprenol L-rhamnosyltransferase